MSINGILGNALSGLNASQAGMRVTSNNIANVNTVGYARQDVNLSAQSIGGVGAGVSVDGIRRITNEFLVSAAMNARARSAASATAFELLNRAQASFGDPTSAGSLFNQINDVFAAFGDTAVDPSSSVRRSLALSNVDTAFAEFDRIATDLQGLRGEADVRIGSAVDRVNVLLNEVVTLNGEIVRGLASGDATGAEDGLSRVLDELSGLIDIRVGPRSGGGVDVRTRDGVLLAGQDAAVLNYVAGGAAGPERIYPKITVQLGSSAPQELDRHLATGEIAGLINLRDRELPGLALELGELAAKTADALNRAHNQGVAFPPPTSLAGRNTGLLGTDALNFQGQTTIALLGADGSLASRIEVDFDAGSILVDGVAQPGFTPGGAGSVTEFVTALNTAMGTVGGSASFANGELALGGGANGLAVNDDATNPSSRGGRGFSHFFGLNDVATSASPMFFETGLGGADAHGFTAGQTLDLRIRGADGSTLVDISYTVAGASIGDIITDLNTQAAGTGTFALDANGALAFTPSAANAGADVQVLDDQTARSGTGVSFTDMFGLGDGARANRALGLAVRSDIDANPALLALGQADLAGAAVGDIVLGSGSAGRAQALAAAATTPLSFDAAGALSGLTTSLTDYAGRVAGDAGARASVAERALTTADSLRLEADARRASVEGVNIEEEMVNLTVYQQSFNAASRLILAAKEMTDTLLSIA